MRVGLTRPHLTLGRFQSYRLLALLLALLLLLIASTFVGNEPLDRLILSLLFLIVLFSAGGAASARRHERWLAATLALASSMCIFAGLVLEKRAIYVPGLALFTVYLAYTIHVVLHRMLTATQIDADILCGAAAIYLLLGVAWAVTYWIIYELDASAFAAIPAIGGPPFVFQDFTYYSLSSLASLGIGDISPVNHFARIWTTLETITGNLYIAVLVSRLVSLYR
jgi:Ion channel